MEVKQLAAQCSRLQETFLRAVENEAGRHAAATGAAIDADAVVAKHRLRADAMAVYDDGAMIRIRVRKRFADPHAVVVVPTTWREFSPRRT